MAFTQNDLDELRSHPCCDDRGNPTVIGQDAAAEIERLRDALAHIRDSDGLTTAVAMRNIAREALNP